LRKRQRIEKTGGTTELPGPCALRQIARHRDEGGANGRHGRDQRLDYVGILAPEMQIRQMNDGLHAGFSPGTMTRSARGRIR
jgi:hypothetical protein